MLAYLSGSIEYSPDHGKAWRAELTPFLRSLGHDVYDPAEDEKKNLSDIERHEFRGWKHTDLPRFQKPSARSLPTISTGSSIGPTTSLRTGTSARRAGPVRRRS